MRQLRCAGRNRDILDPMYIGSYSAEGMKLRLWLLGIILFLVSGYFSYSEFMYLANGRHSTATVVSAAEKREFSSRGRSRYKWEVTYTFPLRDGSERKDTVAMSMDHSDTLVPGATFDVQYMPREANESRVKGDNNAWMTIPFILVSAWMFYSTIKIWREYKEYERASAES